MAETVKYYLANNIITYPTSNSRDTGKLNLEENMASIITRITNRNYALKQEDFTLSVEPDSEYGSVIQMAAGQANIQGYHVITNDIMRIPPPTTLTGNNIVLGMKLARDGSQHLLGDVTENLITIYEGIFVSYFDKVTALANPDIFIIGYLSWDGSQFTNVIDNPEKLGRIDAKDVHCIINDPKHPDIEFMNLQEWMYSVPDWYISKEGDVTYGEIEFMPGRRGTQNPGITIKADGNNLSSIKMKSPDKGTSGHYLNILNDDGSSVKQTILDFYYNGAQRGSLYVRSPDNWLNLGSNSTLNLYSTDNTNIHSNSVVTTYIDGRNNLKTELTDKNYTLTNPLNSKTINFNIDSTDLKFLLGDALFNYNNTLDQLTISGLQRFIVNDNAQFKSNMAIQQTLTLGQDSSNTKLNSKTWVLDSNNITQTFDNSGHLLKQKSGNNEPRSRWENTDGSKYTEIKPGNMELKGPNAGITFKNNNNKTAKVYINNDGEVVIEGNVYIKGGDLRLDEGHKVYGAVYN